MLEARAHAALSRNWGYRTDYEWVNLEEISPNAAIAVCDRHTGAGADGWLLVSKADSADGAIELWNSDGSRSEISGNGTRCAAAFLIQRKPEEIGRAHV